jgi:hypothetical protein
MSLTRVPAQSDKRGKKAADRFQALNSKKLKNNEEGHKI